MISFFPLLQPALALLLSIYFETPLHSLLHSVRIGHIQPGIGGADLLALVPWIAVVPSGCPNLARIQSV
jgi:hypothetical protein